MFSPPTPAELRAAVPYPPDETAAVLESLLHAGELIDGEVCAFHPDAVEAAWQRLEAHLTERGRITISEFRELLGTTRRFALPLLQHFDALGKLVREGDHRRLRT